MTLEQLRVFVAVAEREHLTAGARSINLTPSAATAAIHAIEERYGTKLFHRVGRRLELSESGRTFLLEARRVLRAAANAELVLRELGGLTRGKLAVAASQTLAKYWLPAVLMRFASAYPGIEVSLLEGNTETVSAAVKAGHVEFGCIEGSVDDPALALTPLAEDRLVVVAAPHHPLVRKPGVTRADLEACEWVLREPGSGTRAVFEASLRAVGFLAERLKVTLCLPSNEAACAAVSASACLTAVSELVARPQLDAGRLALISYNLPPRQFALVAHKERFRSRAGRVLEDLLCQEAERLSISQREPDFHI